MANKCFLRCVGQTHPDILLQNNLSICLGRGPETKIKDKRCSREHIRFSADYNNLLVNVEVLGANSSSVNKTVLSKGQSVQARHADIIYFLTGAYGHKVMFQPEPERKRKHEDGATTTLNKVEKKIKNMTSDQNGSHSKLSLDLGVKEIAKSGDYLWEEVSDGHVYVMTTTNCSAQSKIAAFDMDGTLIATKSGRVFPIDLNDWKILYAEVPGKLKRLVEDGFKIVVLTNQAGIAKGKVKFADFKIKVENISKKLGVPLQLFCCAGDGGLFRKPRIGVWTLLSEKKNSDVKIDSESSFYCGDAAGREKDWQLGKKKDFSCSDRLFAKNLGLRFLTPEEFFLGQKATTKFQLPEFDPKAFLSSAKSHPKLTTDVQEVVLLVGIQGSGKSHLSKEEFEPQGYVIASNDKTGSRDKTLRLLDKSLSEGKSVVVDNTNGEKETRKKSIDLAKKHRVPCRCLVMLTSHQHARHNNLFRELTSTDHAKIKEPLFHSYKSKYQAPSIEEGYSEIVEVEFVPKFKNEAEEELYKMYLLEK